MCSCALILLQDFTDSDQEESRTPTEQSPRAHPNGFALQKEDKVPETKVTKQRIECEEDSATEPDEVTNEEETKSDS